MLHFFDSILAQISDNYKIGQGKVSCPFRCASTLGEFLLSHTAVFGNAIEIALTLTGYEYFEYLSN